MTDVTAPSAVDTSSAQAPAKAGNDGLLSKLPTPLMTTILAGIVTAAGTILGNFLQNYETLQSEREKQQHELVLKMISIGDLNQAKQNLQFLVESGLITDPEQAKKILASKATPVLPGPWPGSNGRPCGANNTGVMLDGMCVPK
jgi:hypothetical protein